MMKVFAATIMAMCLSQDTLSLYSRCKWIIKYDWPVIICQNGFKTIIPYQVKKIQNLSDEEMLKRLDWENDKLYGAAKKNYPKAENKILENQISEKLTIKLSNASHAKNSFNNGVTVRENSVNNVINKDLKVVAFEEQDLKRLHDFPFILKYSEEVLVETENHLTELASAILSSDLNVIKDSSNYRPSVTVIIQKTMPEESAAILERWRKKMIEKLGLEGFAKYQHDVFQRGTLLHKKIKKHLSGEEYQFDSNSEMDAYWESVSTILKDVSDTTAIETNISHPYLCYHGIADCIAKYKNQRMLIEWKTSEKPKPSLKYTYDNPLQVVAYMGAYNSMAKSNLEQIDTGLIVIAYADGSPAHAHVMSRTVCEDNWKLWLLRLQQYWQFKIYNEKKFRK